MWLNFGHGMLHVYQIPSNETPFWFAELFPGALEHFREKSMQQELACLKIPACVPHRSAYQETEDSFLMGA